MNRSGTRTGTGFIAAAATIAVLALGADSAFGQTRHLQDSPDQPPHQTPHQPPDQSPHLPHTVLLPHVSNRDTGGPVPRFRWTESNDGLAGWSIVGVAVDHANPATVYALTRSHGLYKSENGGGSWLERNVGLPETHIVSMGHTHGNLLTMDPNDSSRLYANFNGQVHRYVDPGGWTNVNAGIDVCNSAGVVGVLVDPQDSDHIFAAHIVSGCSGGIFEARDALAPTGPTWTEIASWSGSGEIENDAWTLAIDPRDASLLFSAPPYLGFLYSVDGGHHWRRSTPLGPGRKAGSVVVVHPQITNRVILGHGTGLHVGEYSRTGEELTFAWRDHTAAVPGLVWDIDIARSDGQYVYVVSTAGVFRSTDGGLSWGAMGDHSPLFPKSIAIDPTDPEVVYLGTGSGLMRSDDGGATLADVTGDIPFELDVQATAIAPSDPDVYYCNLFGVAFCRSDDRGTSWRCTSADPGVTRTITIHVDENDPDVVYAGLEGLHKSVDGGASWDLVLDPGRPEQFFDLAVDSHGRLFAASVHTVSAGERYAELYRSDDAGLTWQGPIESFRHPSIWVGGIAVDASDAVFVATYDFVRRSTDAGRSWTKLTTGLTEDRYDRWIDGLAVDRAQPGRLYVATRSHRVFTSTDYGDSWRLVDAPTPAYPGRIIVDHGDNSVFYVFGLEGWHRYVGFGSASAQMPTDGIDAPHKNFRRSALQDSVDASSFVTGDLFQGFLRFDSSLPGEVPYGSQGPVGSPGSLGQQAALASRGSQEEPGPLGPQALGPLGSQALGPLGSQALGPLGPQGSLLLP